jgi:hypothetical protein
MLPGIAAEMREFGQSGIKCHQRELLAANRDEIETLLTMLKLCDDWARNGVASAMAFVEGQTRERRRSPDGILLAGVASLLKYIGQEPRP